MQIAHAALIYINVTLPTANYLWLICDVSVSCSSVIVQGAHIYLNSCQYEPVVCCRDAQYTLNPQIISSDNGEIYIGPKMILQLINGADYEANLLSLT